MARTLVKMSYDGDGFFKVDPIDLQIQPRWVDSSTAHPMNAIEKVAVEAMGMVARASGSLNLDGITITFWDEV